MKKLIDLKISFEFYLLLVYHEYVQSDNSSNCHGEQEEAIRAFFAHNDWTFEKIGKYKEK